MNSDMVKLEKCGQMHLVYHFTVPLRFISVTAYRLYSVDYSIFLMALFMILCLMHYWIKFSACSL